MDKVEWVSNIDVDYAGLSLVRRNWLKEKEVKNSMGEKKDSQQED